MLLFDGCLVFLFMSGGWLYFVVCYEWVEGVLLDLICLDDSELMGVGLVWLY